MYKKRLLNSAIALALATTGGAAIAHVDIDSNSGQETYANETLDVNNWPAGDGWVNDNGTGEIDVEGALGWSVGAAGAPRFMRFDLFNAVLETPLAPGDLTLTINSGALYSVSISGGGQAGDDFVIFEVTNTDGALPINNTDSFDLDIDEVLADLPKTTTEIRYRAFETGLIAQNAAGDDPVDINETFKDEQVDWFYWGTGFAVACGFNPGEEGVIDTIDRAFWEFAPFTPGQPRQIASASADTFAGILNPVNSLQVDFVDYFAAGNALVTIEGNFQGIQFALLDADQDLSTPPAVGFGPNLGPDPFAPNGAQIVYNGFFPPTPPGGFQNAGLYLINTTDRDGDSQPDEMVPSEYRLRFAQPLANAADFVLNDVVTACGETVASGSSDRLDYTASPDGTGVNVSLFRLVNPSDTAGPVVMRVYNDDGDWVEFPIDEITGIDSDVLDAKSSSPVIPVASVNDVALAAGLPTPAPASNGAKRDKFRIEVRAGFGQESYDGNLNFNAIFDDSDGGFVLPGPSGSGFLRVQGEEQQQRSANGVQIQGFMLNDQNTLVPYNER